MRAKEFITEVSKDWDQRREAWRQLDILYSAVLDDKTKFDPAQMPTAIQQAKKLVSTCGRAFKPYRNFSAGYMFDQMVQQANKISHQAGTLALPTAAANISAFANQVATYFSSLGATYRHKTGTVWMCSNGTKHRDPENYVAFKNEEDRELAWDKLSKKGKRLYIAGAVTRNSPTEYLQFGKVLISRDSVTYGAFSSNPESHYGLAFQSAAIVKNDYYHVHDITDQQAAALQDIAATKNANAMAGIKAIMAVLKGEQDVKKVLDNSAKITTQDKAKLDAIIAGAANFKESATPTRKIVEAQTKNVYDYKRVEDDERIGYATIVNGEEVAFYPAKSKWDAGAASDAAKKHMIMLRSEEINAENKAREHEYQYVKPLTEIEKRWVELDNRFMSLNDEELAKWVRYSESIRKSLRNGTHPACTRSRGVSK